MITPKEASKSLTIPSSTLRRWSKEFSDHLSPHEKGKHRSYTTTDLHTLSKIRDLLNDGLKYDDIHKRLDAIEKPSEKESALMLIGEFTRELESNRAEIKALSSRLDDLEEWLALPPLKRLFTPPPKREKKNE